jgi:AcrR family transcriptional regulator
MTVRRQRTKEAIKQGYLEWILKNNKMPHVKELAEELNINRGTFYLHYADVYAVLDDLENDTITNIKKIVVDYRNQSLLQLIVLIIEHIQTNRAVFQVLLSSKTETHYIQKLIREMKKFVPRSPIFSQIEDDEVRDYITTFIFAGSISVFANWIREDSRMPPQEIVKKMHQFFVSPITTHPNGKVLHQKCSG